MSWKLLELCELALNAVFYKRCFPFQENFGYRINFPFEHAEDRMSTLSPNINSRCLKKHYSVQWKIPRFSQLLSQQTRHFVPFGSLFVFNQIINSKWISSVFSSPYGISRHEPYLSEKWVWESEGSEWIKVWLGCNTKRDELSGESLSRACLECASTTIIIQLEKCFWIEIPKHFLKS